MTLQTAAHFLLDILFPRRCLWCNGVIGFETSCPCESEIAALSLPDTPLPKDRRPDAYLENIWACYSYKEPAGNPVRRLKLQDEPELAPLLAEFLAQKYMACRLNNHYDLVIPVPVSRKTIRRRGFNHAALLANSLCEKAGLPYGRDLLVKSKETRRQMTLTREERLLNISDAYQVPNQEAIAGRNVLLIDDVVTTGSTLNECAKTLLSRGAASCGALCFAATPETPK